MGGTLEKQQSSHRGWWLLGPVAVAAVPCGGKEGDQEDKRGHEGDKRGQGGDTREKGTRQGQKERKGDKTP